MSEDKRSKGQQEGSKLVPQHKQMAMGKKIPQEKGYPEGRKNED